jgi:hypothetical protein
MRDVFHCILTEISAHVKVVTFQWIVQSCPSKHLSRLIPAKMFWNKMLYYYPFSTFSLNKPSERSKATIQIRPIIVRQWEDKVYNPSAARFVWKYMVTLLRICSCPVNIMRRKNYIIKHVSSVLGICQS